MPWVRFDDQFPIHRKVKGLSDAAFRLHAEAIFWCARNLTDGFVSTEDVSDLATARRPHKLIPELVGRGNWVERDGGWQIHDYLDYQFSKEKVGRERQAKADRQARWLAKKSNRDASQDASRDASLDAAPSPPRPEGSGAGGPERRPTAVGARRATANRRAITNCKWCDGDGWRWHPDGKRHGVLGERCDHHPPERQEAS